MSGASRPDLSAADRPAGALRSGSRSALIAFVGRQGERSIADLTRSCPPLDAQLAAAVTGEADAPRRVSDHDLALQYILDHDRAGPNDGPGPDRETGKDDRPGPN